ncbi:MAG: hypothetical protein IKO26_00025 [Paludibacteraceae bacterium]|nr:hypothetical protein [Paludibacteraceae bacterium]
MRHYFDDEKRMTERVTLRFTPVEMKMIDTIMESLGRANKAEFLHNTLMSQMCRHREALIEEGTWKGEKDTAEIS